MKRGAKEEREEINRKNENFSFYESGFAIRKVEGFWEGRGTHDDP